MTINQQAHTVMVRMHNGERHEAVFDTPEEADEFVETVRGGDLDTEEVVRFTIRGGGSIRCRPYAIQEVAPAL